MTHSALASVLNAVSNSSRQPVSEREVLHILATGEGPGHIVRALFGDCSFETLDRLADGAGITRAQLRAGYAKAKQDHGAINADLDENNLFDRVRARVEPLGGVELECFARDQTREPPDFE